MEKKDKRERNEQTTRNMQRKGLTSMSWSKKCMKLENPCCSWYIYSREQKVIHHIKYWSKPSKLRKEFIILRGMMGRIGDHPDKSTFSDWWG